MTGGFVGTASGLAASVWAHREAATTRALRNVLAGISMIVRERSAVPGGIRRFERIGRVLSYCLDCYFLARGCTAFCLLGELSGRCSFHRPLRHSCSRRSRSEERRVGK